MNRKQLIEELGEATYLLYKKIVIEGRNKYNREVVDATRQVKKSQQEIFEIEMSGVVI